MITSSYFTATSDVQALKIRYKYPGSGSAQIAVYNSGGSAVGVDDLSCTNCVTGEWVDKYLRIYTSAQGQSIRIRVIQSSGTTEVDEFGTQWQTFQEWVGTSSGINSQPKGDHSQYAEVRGSLFTKPWILTENRLEFDYSFPSATGNSFAAYLYRDSDDSIIATKGLSGNGIGWTRTTWTWGTNYIGTSVYLKFSGTESKPTWVDNVGVNFPDAQSMPSRPSWKAGDPFDTTSGQFTHLHTDLAIPGKGVPLAFTRTYLSMATRSGDLGYGWSHTYSTRLRIDSDNSVTVYYGTGGAAFFKYNAGSYTPPGDVHDSLVKQAAQMIAIAR